MSWVKLDDRFHGNRKVRKAWRKYKPAVGLFAMALTYCAQQETDGHVDVDWVEEQLPVTKERQKAVNTLIECGLWDKDGEDFRVHDYLDYNESRADLTARREREAERKRRGRDTQSHRASARTPDGQDADVRSDKPWTPQVVHGESDGPDPTRPVPSRPGVDGASA